MNINNPIHIKPKLVSNNLGTIETNGNFKLTEETNQGIPRTSKNSKRTGANKTSTRKH